MLRICETLRCSLADFAVGKLPLTLDAAAATELDTPFGIMRGIPPLSSTFFGLLAQPCDLDGATVDFGFQVYDAFGDETALVLHVVDGRLTDVGEDLAMAEVYMRAPVDSTWRWLIAEQPPYSVTPAPSLEGEFSLAGVFAGVLPRVRDPAIAAWVMALTNWFGSERSEAEPGL